MISQRYHVFSREKEGINERVYTSEEFKSLPLDEKIVGVYAISTKQGYGDMIFSLSRVRDVLISRISQLEKSIKS